jgi:hypothetical protein
MQHAPPPTAIPSLTVSAFALASFDVATLPTIVTSALKPG